MAETYGVSASGVGVLAATAKTVAAVISGSTACARIVSADITAKNGVTTQNSEILVELVRYTTAGTSTAQTPSKMNGEAQNKAALCTAGTNYSVEPSGTVTVLKSWYVPSTSGMLQQLPLGREIYLPASTTIGLRVNSPQAQTVAVNLEFEE